MKKCIVMLVSSLFFVTACAGAQVQEWQVRMDTMKTGNGM